MSVEVKPYLAVAKLGPMGEAICQTSLGFALYVCDDFMEFRTPCCEERVFEDGEAPGRYYCSGPCEQHFNLGSVRIPFHFFQDEEVAVLESFAGHFASLSVLESAMVTSDLLDEIREVRARFREFNHFPVRRGR